MMAYTHIIAEVTPASVGTITLNRPDSLNALTSACWTSCARR
jgi:enoyl-CoA hydratase/carnithine racemase